MYNKSVANPLSNVLLFIVLEKTMLFGTPVKAIVLTNISESIAECHVTLRV